MISLARYEGRFGFVSHCRQSVLGVCRKKHRALASRLASSSEGLRGYVVNFERNSSSNPGFTTVQSTRQCLGSFRKWGKVMWQHIFGKPKLKKGTTSEISHVHPHEYRWGYWHESLNQNTFYKPELFSEGRTLTYSITNGEYDLQWDHPWQSVDWGTRCAMFSAKMAEFFARNLNPRTHVIRISDPDAGWLYCQSPETFFAGFADILLHMAEVEQKFETKIEQLQTAKTKLVEADQFRKNQDFSWAKNSYISKKINTLLQEAEQGFFKQQTEKEAQQPTEQKLHAEAIVHPTQEIHKHETKEKTKLEAQKRLFTEEGKHKKEREVYQAQKQYERAENAKHQTEQKYFTEETKHQTKLTNLSENKASTASLAHITEVKGLFAVPATSQASMKSLAIDNVINEDEIHHLETLRDADDASSTSSSQSMASSQFHSLDKKEIAQKLVKRINEKGDFNASIKVNRYIEVEFEPGVVHDYEAKIMQQTLRVLFCKPNTLTKVSEICWRIEWAALRDIHVREFKQKHTEQSLLVHSTLRQSQQVTAMSQALTVQRQQEHLRVFFATVSSLLAQHSENLPQLQTGFISYPWYGNIEITKQLQARLKIIVELFRILGLDIHLDIQRMHGNIDDYMTTRINNSEVIFVVGTPELTSRLAASGPNNLKTEYNHIRARQRVGNCLVIPLLFEGDYSTAFPIEQERPWSQEFIYDLRQLDATSPVSSIGALAGLENPLGLIPTLWGLREYPHLWTLYRSAYELLDMKCRSLPAELESIHEDFVHLGMQKRISLTPHK